MEESDQCSLKYDFAMKSSCVIHVVLFSLYDLHIQYVVVFLVLHIHDVTMNCMWCFQSMKHVYIQYTIVCLVLSPT